VQHCAASAAQSPAAALTACLARRGGCFSADWRPSSSLSASTATRGFFLCLRVPLAGSSAAVAGASVVTTMAPVPAGTGGTGTASGPASGAVRMMLVYGAIPWSAIPVLPACPPACPYRPVPAPLLPVPGPPARQSQPDPVSRGPQRPGRCCRIAAAPWCVQEHSYYSFLHSCVPKLTCAT